MASSTLCVCHCFPVCCNTYLVQLLNLHFLLFSPKPGTARVMYLQYVLAVNKDEVSAPKQQPLECDWRRARLEKCRHAPFPVRTIAKGIEIFPPLFPFSISYNCESDRWKVLFPIETNGQLKEGEMEKQEMFLASTLPFMLSLSLSSLLDSGRETDNEDNRLRRSSIQQKTDCSCPVLFSHIRHPQSPPCSSGGDYRVPISEVFGLGNWSTQGMHHK